jgi:GDPmannose 4,6-dehydratase
MSADTVRQALITGIGGQDGHYLAELLGAKGYRVFGLMRPESPSLDAVRRRFPDVQLIEGDLMDAASLVRAVSEAEPDEVYNLGGVSSLGESIRRPVESSDVIGLGAVRLLEAVRIAAGGFGGIRFYQASSSEMFGSAPESPQRETTPFSPRSPYAAAKLLAHHATLFYREAHGLHASSGILFNHESPMRGADFVTRKVSRGVARIALSKEDRLALGNLDARRDWGFAGDYVEAMWLMLQQDNPGDYVVATGETHTVRELVTEAFAVVGIDDWSAHVTQGTGLIRRDDVDMVVGDASRARTQLGWAPKVSFRELVRMMVEADLDAERATA